ncbi:MAG: hypothetical protein VXV73_07165, partial [Actinomycetota bacterium]|nr:hypothetical protein [Actinomycetota bacterium]
MRRRRAIAPTLRDFCVAMMGRADIKGGKKQAHVRYERWIATSQLSFPKKKTGAGWVGARHETSTALVRLVIPVVTFLTPLAGHFSAFGPRASSPDPRASNLYHQASSIELRPSSLEPRASSLEPRPSSLEPRASSLEPRASNL